MSDLTELMPKEGFPAIGVPSVGVRTCPWCFPLGQQWISWTPHPVGRG